MFIKSDDPEYVDDDEKQFFHHVVAQLISRARKDTKGDVDSLCNQVRIPDEYD